MTLHLAEFDEFYSALHEGHTPFPWQRRLLRLVVEQGRWPSILDLPTGTGKTSALEIFVFALALEAERPASERRLPIRAALVIDRRTVVAQAYDRAKAIEERLSDAMGSGALARVAEQLRRLAGSEQAAPLKAVQLRGGIALEHGWTENPTQPALIVSTVDQVGSRILFRGYGVSPGMRPIHAGLLTHDTLILLDEVHLSVPFRQTLESLQGRFLHWHTRAGDGGELDVAPLVPLRWQYVQMSATHVPAHENPDVVEREEPFRLDENDREHLVLQERLQASKPVTLVPVDVKGGGREVHLARVCARLLEDRLIRGKAIGVVVNRVSTARRTFEVLQERFGNSADVALITGRMRPLDRDAQKQWLDRRIASERDSSEEDRAVIVVATQCIEAGADFDFDVLVTECASLDALVQRFGRLNRLGRRTALGFVLGPSDRRDDDPIYGAALAVTWDYLRAEAKDRPLDFGIAHFRYPAHEQFRRLTAPAESAPLLLPAYLDAWAQTRPSPAVQPDVALWLHGKKDCPAEVQIVWRADLSEEFLASAVDPELGRSALACLRDRLQACPPGSAEALGVPLQIARAWLLHKARAALSFSDVEGEPVVVSEEAGESRFVVVFRGDESEVIRADEIRPEMTLVVPVSYGGIAEDGNWAPHSETPVFDWGDVARWQKTGRAMLRLAPSLVEQYSNGTSPPPLPDAEQGVNRDWYEDVGKWLRGWVLRSDAPPQLDALVEWFASRAESIRDKPAFRCQRLETVVTERSGYLVLRQGNRDTDLVDAEDDGASHTGVAVSLPKHLSGVREYAKQFAERLGFPQEVAEDLALAAWWHDVGKVDPRFQVLLQGGDRFRAATEEQPLAKSRIVHTDAAARRRARLLSAYPTGARHELLSVALMERLPALRQRAHDWELVLHLVASHHGWCRSLAPVAVDVEPVEVSWTHDGFELAGSTQHELSRVDSGIAERYWSVTRRYGWFGLAWFEAVLRLADHQRSRDEQERNSDE